MGTRRKGSELIFNLQWKDKPDNGGDRSNIIGMYDTPATTLNFETFKSYLLKNSGIVGNDVKVTYLTDNGAEWVIDSQEWFEIALCAFRLKARLGEIIFLKLENITSPSHPQMARKHSNDVETQSEHNSITNFDAPPEWFLLYMTQFKKELLEEVTYAVSSNVAATSSKDKETTAPPVIVLPRRGKPESSKRSRKHMILGENPIDKELLKTLKFDRKIESKLDKLDAKTKKIKEKKQALINKIDNDDYRHVKRPQVLLDIDNTPLMNAALVSESAVIPHMIGGETYLHTWEIKNNGKIPWTSKTELRLTWGSSDLVPSVNVIRCQPLQPGEKGSLYVRFLVPKKPGQYESYWNFYDRDVRFGQGLCCTIIVDGPISNLAENVPSLSSKKPKIEQEQKQNVFPEKPSPEKQTTSKEKHFVVMQEVGASGILGAPSGVAMTNHIMDLSKRMQDVNFDSDSDWESLGSCGKSRKPKNFDDGLVDDFDPLKTNKYGIQEKDLIVDLSKNKSETTSEGALNETKMEIGKEEEKKQTEEIPVSNDDNNNNGTSINNNSSRESICEIGSEASDLSSGYDVITAPVCDEREEASGYVYITVDGNKLPVPKHIIRPDFLESVEEAPGPVSSEDDEKTAPVEASPKETTPEEVTPVCKTDKERSEQIFKYTKSFMNVMQNSSYDAFADATPGQHTRVFVFPQDNPGFEFLYYPKGLDSARGDTGPYHRFKKISVIENGAGWDNGNFFPEGTSTEQNNQSECVLLPTKEQNSPKVTEDNATSNVPVFAVKSETASRPVNNIESAPPTDPFDYSWARSETQYTFPDMQSACAAANLKCDPYGPLEQSRPTSSQSSGMGQNQFTHVPNYQQSKPILNRSQFKQRIPTAPPQQHSTPTNSPVQPNVPVHILPENLVSGAVNVASSAINTARSVISMIVPPKVEAGKWVNGHWVTENYDSTRAKNLTILADMGFWDVDLNATLLARYNDDVAKVVSELLQ